MEYFVYIIYSELKDRYYVGSTQNLDKRLLDHNNSRSKYTRGSKDWEIKWYKECSSRSEAMQLEYSIKKKKSRKYLEFLISNKE